MSPLGAIHTATAVAALVLGAVVLIMSPKGTRRHRQLGWAYVISMVALNGTALFIYRLFRVFGPFHVAAIFSLVTVLLGVAAGIGARQRRLGNRRRPQTDFVAHHYFWMTYSYVGLVAAAVAEAVTRFPATRPAPGQGIVFGLSVVVASIVVFVIGSRLVRRGAQAAITPHRRAVVKLP